MAEKRLKLNSEGVLEDVDLIAEEVSYNSVNTNNVQEGLDISRKGFDNLYIGELNYGRISYPSSSTLGYYDYQAISNKIKSSKYKLNTSKKPVETYHTSTPPSESIYIWAGYIRSNSAGTRSLTLTARCGSFLVVNGKKVLEINGDNGFSLAQDTKSVLIPNYWVPVEIITTFSYFPTGLNINFGSDVEFTSEINTVNVPKSFMYVRSEAGSVSLPSVGSNVVLPSTLRVYNSDKISYNINTGEFTFKEGSYAFDSTIRLANIDSGSIVLQLIDSNGSTISNQTAAIPQGSVSKNTSGMIMSSIFVVGQGQTKTMSIKVIANNAQTPQNVNIDPDRSFIRFMEI